jgi:hypothetical protein
MESAAVLTSIATGVLTAVVAIVAFWFSRHTQRYAAQRAIGDLQSSLVHYRAQYPEITKYSRGWTTGDFIRLYADDGKNAAAVRYYGYIDLGLEFCNTALAASRRRHIGAEVFEAHYRPLLRYFLAENYPFVESTLNGPYLSSFIRDELRLAEKEGWDWALRHEDLTAGVVRP